MSLTGKAIKYLKTRFPNVDFLKDIILQDDGDGPYVKYWGIGEVPQLTEAQLNALGEQHSSRIPFPSQEEQLNLLYQDMKNGTSTFVARLNAYYNQPGL